jgi:hypothetical protein
VKADRRAVMKEIECSIFERKAMVKVVIECDGSERVGHLKW